MLDNFKTFSPFYILRGQWKATRAYDKNPDPRRHSKIAVFLIFVLPISIFFIFLFLGLSTTVRVTKVADGILSSMGVLAAALIASFSLLASWRGGMQSAREETRSSTARAEDGDLWLLDSSSAHMLAGAYSSVLASVIAMILVIFEQDLPYWIDSISYAFTLLLVTHVTMSLIISLPGLYAAYMSINNVRAALNGLDSLNMNEEDKHK